MLPWVQLTVSQHGFGCGLASQCAVPWSKPVGQKSWNFRRNSNIVIKKYIWKCFKIVAILSRTQRVTTCTEGSNNIQNWARQSYWYQRIDMGVQFRVSACSSSIIAGSSGSHGKRSQKSIVTDLRSKWATLNFNPLSVGAPSAKRD